MTGKPNRREVLTLGLGLSLSGVAFGQQEPNVRLVPPGANVQDPGVINPLTREKDPNDPDKDKEPEDRLWVLHFKFKDPGRLIVA